MKFVIYKCDECKKSLNRDDVYFFNYKDIHYELCKECFIKYKEWRSGEKERHLKEKDKNNKM